jgi:hypothetical protein
VKLRAAVGGVLAAAALALPGVAQQAAESGAEAFARKDFAAAAELWRKEAAAGSAEAKFGLGLISDLGLGVPRDAAKALRWYLEAADDGLADAQFNVAVMLDAGTGVPRDVGAAAVWYGRAAANGHHRAQYNLGLLYEAGEGVPQNPDLARYWLGRAAEVLPAAAERLAMVAPARSDQRGFEAPGLLAGAVVTKGDGPRAEMVWTAPPGPPGARFLLEVARLPAANETSGSIVVSSSTEGSAHAARLPARSAGYAWRVSLVDASAARYAPSPWRQLFGAGEDTPAALPEGRVSIRVSAGDARAGQMARELAESFFGAGLWVRIEPAADAADQTSVRYAWREDAGLAAGIAEFLPVLAAGDAIQSPDLGAAPGEIVVRLVGGPDGSTP